MIYVALFQGGIDDGLSFATHLPSGSVRIEFIWPISTGADGDVAETGVIFPTIRLPMLFAPFLRWFAVAPQKLLRAGGIVIELANTGLQLAVFFEQRSG